MADGRVSPGPVERLPLDALSPWWGEHRSRYRHAAAAAAGAVVLDIAAGTGYGSIMLAGAGARLVVGCDLATDALRDIRARAPESVSYVAGSGLELPFDAATFDLVISFETIEHLHDGAAFVDELRRVLRPNGALVLSTPNADVTRAYPSNPYHIHEYTAPELDALLSARFASVRLLGQQLDDRYSVSPFLPGYDRPQGFGEHVEALVWKALRRLRRDAGDLLSRLLLRRGLYPSEHDFSFEPSTDGAHVIVAHCRP